MYICEAATAALSHDNESSLRIIHTDTSKTKIGIKYSQTKDTEPR